MAALPLLLTIAFLPLLSASPVPGQSGNGPEVSANALFLAGYTKREDPGGAPTSRTGLYAQRLEVYLAAPVDSTRWAEVTLALPRDGQVEMMEAGLRADLGGRVRLQAGQFLAPFGAHNLLHPQAFPFLDPPLVLERLFGEEGLAEVGVGLHWALPRRWRTELDAHMLNGDNPLWVSRTDEDFLFLTHLRSRWDLGEGGSLVLGGSWAGGRNPSERFTHALGFDLAVTWRPGGAADAGQLAWQTEYVYARENLKTHYRRRGGACTNLQYQLARRWRVQARYDRYGLPADGAEGREHRASFLVAYSAHPLLPLRFQYSRWSIGREGRGYNQYHIQLSFTLDPRAALPRQR